MSVRVLCSLMSFLFLCVYLISLLVQMIGLCLAAYSLCSAILCWSVLLMQHQSAIPAMPPASDNYSHVFHGLRPLKATQVASHQSEIMLPPLQASVETTPCPSCRQCCCNNVQGHFDDSQSMSDSDTSPCHLPDNTHLEPLSCQQCRTRRIDDDLWLRTKVDDVGQALITFYRALLVAYYDTSSEILSSNNSDPGSPVDSRSHPINHSTTQGERTSAPPPSEHLPNPNCALLSRPQGMLNPRNSNMNSDSTLASRKQCSVCDGMAKRKLLQDRIHTLLPRSMVESALPAATGTIPLIVA